MDYKKEATNLVNKISKYSGFKVHKKTSNSIHGELALVKYLLENKDLTSSSLSKYMHITTARVAAILNSLEKKGFIKRELSKTDHRKTIISVTDEGKIDFENKMDKLINHISEIFEYIGENDTLEYCRILLKIVEFQCSVKGEKND